jgi:hypothetical protein
MENDEIRAEAERQKRLLSQPIDFAQLERDGLLREAGAWYEVPNMHLLPEHVVAQITETAAGPNGVRVKFRAAFR